MTSLLRDLKTIRAMQVFAGLCLSKYCAFHDLKHSAIDELLAHLFSIATTNDLPEWDSKGAQLDLCGRGEEAPKSLLATIPPDKVRTFSQLVDWCVEVGIVDLYGADTAQPRRCLSECLGILKLDCIAPPAHEPLLEFFAKRPPKGGESSESEHWGHCVPHSGLKTLLAIYGITIDAF